MQGIVPALFALAGIAMPPPLFAPPQPRSDDLGVLVKGNTQFAFDLYQQLRIQPGNLFLSPHSISSALAMTYGGARGATADEMARVLHFNLPPERLHPSFSALARGLRSEAQGRSGCQLRIANALWGHRAGRFLPPFLNLTREHYNAGFYGVDYTNPEPARQMINDWVARETQGKIRDLLAPGNIDARTRLVLTNAIYFKGEWDSPFQKDSTTDKAFHLVSGQKIQAPLMWQKGHFGYAEAPELQILEMPYAGSNVSMVVLLPRTVDGLAQLEKMLTAEVLDGWLKRVWKQEVDVTLPRFKVEDSFSLAAVLRTLGMGKVFNPAQADLSGIGGVPGEPPLYVSAVIHKAFADVTEGGTEAAAATAVVMAPGAAPGQFQPPPIPTFRADHPFLFLIRDQRLRQHPVPGPDDRSPLSLSAQAADPAAPKKNWDSLFPARPDRLQSLC